MSEVKSSYQKRLVEVDKLQAEIKSLKNCIHTDAKIFFQDRGWLGFAVCRYGFVDQDGKTQIVEADA